jgi:glucosylglycerate synthase
VDVESIPQQAQEKTAPVDSADLVVGLLTSLDQDGMQAFYQGFHSLPGSPRIVVLHGEPGSAAAAATPQAVEGNSSVSLLPWSMLNADPATPVQSISAACRSLFAATEKLGAKGCCLVASEMESATPDWVCQLLNPLLESEMDLVIPYYTPHKWQGLLNGSILYPLIRSLYGKRIHNPLGPDVGVSRRLAQKLTGATRNGNAGTEQTHPLASLTPVSVCDNLQICQVRVGSRVYPPTDWINMSSLVAQVLGPIFLEMERGAPCWQRTRGSVSVPARGEPRSLPEDAGAADINVGRMLETFQLGVRDLQEIWSLVLPPATLFELRKLSRLTPDKFTMPDELWARIVYDFALAHRLRTINRDHLLRSMTPLYLAWVGSYTRELQTAGAAAVEQRIERLALAYEAAKPYLISRWRWPDRFNP